MKDDIIYRHQAQKGKMMNDLISRQAAMVDFENSGLDDDSKDTAVRVLEQLPSAQPERTGRWIDITKTGGDFVWKCSECGELNLEDTYYCPNCGAKMEE